MNPTLTTPPTTLPRWPARLAATLLRRAGAALERAAAALLRPAGRSLRREFGPDGAVYEDGRLLGFLDGVRRL